MKKNNPMMQFKVLSCPNCHFKLEYTCTFLSRQESLWLHFVGLFFKCSCKRLIVWFSSILMVNENFCCFASGNSPGRLRFSQ